MAARALMISKKSLASVSRVSVSGRAFASSTSSSNAISNKSRNSSRRNNPNHRRNNDKRRGNRQHNMNSPAVLRLETRETLSAASAANPLSPLSDVYWVPEGANDMLQDSTGSNSKHYVELAHDLDATVARSQREKLWTSMNPVNEFLARCGRASADSYKALASSFSQAPPSSLCAADTESVASAALANTYKWMGDPRCGILVAAARHGASSERRSTFIRDVARAAATFPISNDDCDFFHSVLGLRNIPGTKDAVTHLLDALVARLDDCDAVAQLLLENGDLLTEELRLRILDGVIASSNKPDPSILSTLFSRGTPEQRTRIFKKYTPTDLGSEDSHYKLRVCSALIDVAGESEAVAVQNAISDVEALVKKYAPENEMGLDAALALLMRHGSPKMREDLIAMLLSFDAVEPTTLAIIGSHINDEQKAHIFNNLAPSVEAAVADMNKNPSHASSTTIRLAIECATNPGECERVLSEIVPFSSEWCCDGNNQEIIRLCLESVNKFGNVPSRGLIAKSAAKKLLGWTSSTTKSTSPEELNVWISLIRMLVAYDSVQASDTSMQLVLSSMWSKGKEICSHEGGYGFVVDVLESGEPSVQRVVKNGVLSCARHLGSTEFGSQVLLALLDLGTSDTDGTRKRMIESTIVPFAGIWASTEHGRDFLIRACAYADSHDGGMIRASVFQG